MKGKVWMTLTVLSLGVMLVGVSVFAQSVPLKANIPFRFTVGNKELSPGEYTAQVISNGNVLQLRSADGGNAAFTLTMAAHTNNISSRCRFVFNRYGKQYFLSKIWWPESATGTELPKSSHESELARTVESQSVSVSSPNQ